LQPDKAGSAPAFRRDPNCGALSGVQQVATVDYCALPIRAIADEWSRQPGEDKADVIWRRLWGAFWHGEFSLQYGTGCVDRDGLSGIIAEAGGLAASSPYPHGTGEHLSHRERQELEGAEYRFLAGFFQDPTTYENFSEQFRTSTLENLCVRKQDLENWCHRAGQQLPRFWRAAPPSGDDLLAAHDVLKFGQVFLIATGRPVDFWQDDNSQFTSEWGRFKEWVNRASGQRLWKLRNKPIYRDELTTLVNAERNDQIAALCSRWSDLRNDARLPPRNTAKATSRRRKANEADYGKDQALIRKYNGIIQAAKRKWPPGTAHLSASKMASILVAGKPKHKLDDVSQSTIEAILKGEYPAYKRLRDKYPGEVLSFAAEPSVTGNSQ
jgi:hypothetical protein